MSLEILGTVCLGSEIETCLGVRTVNQGLLRSGARHGETSRRTVLVKSCLPDETFNVVSVRQRGAERFQNDGRNVVFTRIIVGVFISYSVEIVWGQHFDLALGVKRPIMLNRISKRMSTTYHRDGTVKTAGSKDTIILSRFGRGGDAAKVVVLALCM